jgi:hypothetical protein
LYQKLYNLSLRQSSVLISLFIFFGSVSLSLPAPTP